MFIAGALMAAGLVGCNLEGGSIPTPTPSDPTIGDSCRSAEPNHLCLGVKVVVYKDSTGQPVVGQDATIKNFQTINKVWKQCDLAFQIENYVAVDPVQSGLHYQPTNYPELDDIRNAFPGEHELLIVTTGTWNRTGSLGTTGANAWTAMPDGPPYGTVLERPVGTFANIIAHELGHYLNLSHVSDNADLMNPIIYDASVTLSASQCGIARSAATYFWQNMLR
ncbi:MAG: matrixin family metalloprotease [Bdellovibrionota bacterium]